jgi:hypothetical protein
MQSVGLGAMGVIARMSRFLMIVAAVIVGGTGVARAQAGYQPGTLIVPMDTSHQDVRILKAFGLVYTLLRAVVPVDWVISAGKVGSLVGSGLSRRLWRRLCTAQR